MGKTARFPHAKRDCYRSDFHVPDLVTDVMELFYHLSSRTGTQIGRIQEGNTDRKRLAVPLIYDLHGTVGFHVIRARDDPGTHNIRPVNYVGDCPGIDNYTAIRERQLDRSFQRRENPVVCGHQERFLTYHEERDVCVRFQYLDHLRVEEGCRWSDLGFEPLQQLLALALADRMTFLYDNLFHRSASIFRAQA